MTTQQQPKTRFGWRTLTAYLAVNLLLFFADPFSSAWHYGSQNPAPMEVTAPTDAALSLDQITRILDAIDLAYDAREPAASEKLWSSGQRLVQIVFFPSSLALGMKSFGDYMGPANPPQQAFTLSVKRRYNHLARIAVSQGLRDEGFLFEEEPSLSKKNGQPFASLR